MRPVVVAGLLMLVAGIGVGSVVSEDAILGLWYTEDDKAKVEITKEDGKYSGKIVWLKEPLYPEGDPDQGLPKVDKNNPDSARQNDPILGLTILKDFVFDGSSTWKRGTIYDPDNGKTYRCTMWLDGWDLLKVRGYVGFSVFGRTTEWVRVRTGAEQQQEAPG